MHGKPNQTPGRTRPAPTTTHRLRPNRPPNQRTGGGHDTASLPQRIEAGNKHRKRARTHASTDPGVCNRTPGGLATSAQRQEHVRRTPPHCQGYRHASKGALLSPLPLPLPCQMGGGVIMRSHGPPPPPAHALTRRIPPTCDTGVALRTISQHSGQSICNALVRACGPPFSASPRPRADLNRTHTHTHERAPAPPENTTHLLVSANIRSPRRQNTPEMTVFTGHSLHTRRDRVVHSLFLPSHESKLTMR